MIGHGFGWLLLILIILFGAFFGALGGSIGNGLSLMFRFYLERKTTRNED
ncbi:MAG: hypothetical protein ACXACC_04720 [Promethearchaeota archaeon]|jgi:hypothetical protein